MILKKLFFLTILIFIYRNIYAQSSAEYYKVYDLKCEYLKNPLGIDNVQPLLSWKVNSEKNGFYQKAFQIEIAKSKEELILGKPVIFSKNGFSKS